MNSTLTNGLGQVSSFPLFLRLGLLLAVGLAASPVAAREAQPVRKIRDLVVYEDDRYYSAFPSVVRRPDGELLLAFRRAPNRRTLGEKNNSHTDPNSYLVTVRSRDQGRTWSREPELLLAHPLGGSQDPCLVALRDGTLVCSSYGWAQLKPEVSAGMTNSLRHGPFVFMGGFLLRSRNGGRDWSGPYPPAHCPADTTVDLFGRPTPAYNRGAMCEGRDGRLYWVIAANVLAPKRKSGTHLLVSDDQGRTWRPAGPVAVDATVGFNETSLYETPRGDLVAFQRTADFDDHAVISRSTDGGRSFAPWQDAGFQGHPLHATRLPNKRVLLVYGYRHKPFGIRARVLNPECTDAATAPELVLREDGGTGDLGYPWAVVLSRKEALVVYYFNRADGTRHIAGTLLGW